MRCQGPRTMRARSRSSAEASWLSGVPVKGGLQPLFRFGVEVRLLLERDPVRHPAAANVLAGDEGTFGSDARENEP